MEARALDVLCAVSTGSFFIGAYCHFSFRSVLEYFWPERCESDDLILEIRILREEVVRLSKAAPGQGETASDISFVVWSLLLVLAVGFVARHFVSEILTGPRFEPQLAVEQSIALQDDAPVERKLSRRLGAAGPKSVGDAWICD